jgi:2,5-furandicarboxylate decarboxylase 1
MDMRTFIDRLDPDEIVRIEREVSPVYEVAALTARLEEKVVIFDDVKDSRFKIVTNICSTRERFAEALSCNTKDIHARVARATAEPKEPSVEELRANNKCNTLSILPIVTHFEKDAGAFITSSIIFARDEEHDRQNASIHRMLYLDDRHMAVRMVEGRHLHKCYINAKEHGEDLRVSVAIGVHPAVLIASAYQADYATDELFIANSLMNDELKVGYSNGLLVPSHAEIILEGKILKDVHAEEWMVEMLRTYDYKRKQPVFELDTVRYRDDALYHDILAGYREHRLLMGMPVEAKIYNMVKSVVPTTKQAVLTDGGCNWLHAVISIKKRLEGEAKNAILAAFAAHPSLKLVIVVDDDIDANDMEHVEYAIATRFQADKGLVMISNAKGSSLDPSSDQEYLLTAKLGIDATASLLKDKERFEIAKIPKLDDIDVEDYIYKK